MVDVVLKIAMLKGVGRGANWRYISTQMKGGSSRASSVHSSQLFYDDSKLDFQGNAKRVSESKKQVFWLL